MIGDSGSVAANGVLTLGTALPTTYPNIYIFLPAGAAFALSPAGWYLCQMTSTTVGVIFNNVYVTGQPSVPPQANLVPIVAAGPGAYTGVITAQAGPNWLFSANMFGASGGVCNYTVMTAINNSAGAKVNTVTVTPIGGAAVTILSVSQTTSTGFVSQGTFFTRAQAGTNSGVQVSPQVALPANAGALGAQTPAYSLLMGLSAGPLGLPPTLAVNLSVAVATDFIVLEGCFFEAFCVA
jgi:hypothetical protein